MSTSNVIDRPAGARFGTPIRPEDMPPARTDNRIQAAPAAPLACPYGMMKPNTQNTSRLKSALGLLASVALTLLIVALPLDVERWGSWGYGGAFVLALLSSATVLVPSVALGAALRFGAADTLNPVLVGLLSGLGAGLGESTGYLAGRSGSELARLGQRRWYRRIAGWVERRGTLTVFVLAAVPLPLIDLAGIAAGALGLGYRRFVLACVAGKIVRFVPVALLGSWLAAQGWI